MQPQIDIVLVASPFCFLNREEEFFIYFRYKLHYQEPITIKSLGSIFDPAATFARNRIEVLDTVTKGAVTFEPVSENSSDEKQDHSFVLKPEVESYMFWTTSTQPARWREYPFDISNLTPNRKYTVAYRNHGIAQWYSGSHSSPEEIRSNTEAQTGDSIQVSLIGDQPQFSAREAIRSPPPVTASLSTSTPTCSLSGHPPFTVFLTWKLHEERPIYALVTQEEGRVIGLEFRDPEKNGRRIGPPPDVQQGDEDNAPSSDKEIFVPLNGLKDNFSQEYTLATEERCNGLLHSDTWNLKSGKQYEITLRKSKWRWVYQDEVVEEVRQAEAKVVEMLRQEPCSVWKPDSRAKFHAE